MTTIGFVGLGVMGAPMARNVSRKFDVVVYDVDDARIEFVLSSGSAGDGSLKAADSIAAVGEACEIVVLSLPGSAVVHEVILGSEGLVHSMEEGSVVMDTSTTEPAVVQEAGRVLAESGIDMLDAPVSGGEGGAIQASLSIMVGGEKAVFERCRPVLETMGTTIVHVGKSGMGEVAKLVNNLIVGATFAVVAEGFALGVRSGLDPAVLYAAIRNGWAGSKVLDVAADAMLKQDYSPGGTVDIHWKDLGYALSLAREQDVPTPVTALTYEVFKAARGSGKGPLSQPAIVQLWEELLDFQVK